MGNPLTLWQEHEWRNRVEGLFHQAMIARRAAMEEHRKYQEYITRKYGVPDTPEPA